MSGKKRHSVNNSTDLGLSKRRADGYPVRNESTYSEGEDRAQSLTPCKNDVTAVTAVSSSNPQVASGGGISIISQECSPESSKPKKPLSAYIYFSQEHREVLKRRHPHWSSTEVMKRVSVAWAHMRKEEKARYVLMANEDKRRYEREVRLAGEKQEEEEVKRG